MVSSRINGVFKKDLFCEPLNLAICHSTLHYFTNYFVFSKHLVSDRCENVLDLFKWPQNNSRRQKHLVFDIHVYSNAIDFHMYETSRQNINRLWALIKFHLDISICLMEVVNIKLDGKEKTRRFISDRRWRTVCLQIFLSQVTTDITLYLCLLDISSVKLFSAIHT